MKVQNPIGLKRLTLVILLPLAAFVLQSIFWDAIKPFAWFLFFPAVFFSSWIGGLPGAVIATVISTALAWWAFIPPEYSFALENPFNLASIGLFMGMGLLFGYTQERIKKANRETAEALAAARTANEQLHGANEKITQLYEKTLEIDQLKNQLFANVSHELRTPLSLILGPVAKRLATGNLGDEERRDLEVVDRNARLLYRHVSDLLDVAKLEAGRMHMQYAQVDLAHLARFVASHFEVLARERRIRYTVDASDATPAQVDAEKFQRVLLNILSNAFKFTPDGGAVALTLTAADGHAVIRVQDNGTGVPTAMREAIFERFRQVEGGAARRFGGTGLGLAIVKEFVDLHGGTVEAAEAPGGGALFTVTLPLLAPEGAEIQTMPSTLDEAIDRQALDELRTPNKAAALPPPALAANAPLVLVVEDNPDMNAYVAQALGPHYRVVTAFDGQEGLRKALETRPDLIVSDVMMPRMSGDQMVSALRRHQEMDDVPIVLLTAKADDELRVKLLKEGVQDYVYKPFSVEELLARVSGLISERKRKEASLREAYGLLRTVTDSIPDVVFVKDSTGRYLMINATGAQLLGQRSAEHVIGKHDADFLPPETARKVLEEDQKVMAKGDSKTLEETEIQEGVARTLLSTKAPYRNPQGEIAGVLGIRRDITERKRAEEALQQSATELKDAQRLAGIGSWSWDLRTNRHVWSEEIYRIYGRDPRLPPAVYPEVKEYFTPESWARLAAVVETAVAQGTPYECDAEVVHAKGSRRWITARGEATRDSDGKVIRLHGTVQDITERKRAEEEIHRLNADLERKVVERTAELEAANKELEAFSYSVSHDLRAPLRSIDGFSQALLEDYADRLDEPGRQHIGRVRAATGRMAELIDDMLQLSRVTRAEMHREPVDLSALADSVIADLRRTEPGRQVEVTIPPGLTAEGDAKLLRIALVNLLANAWKFTGRQADARIKLGTQDGDDGRAFYVRDNGVGFDMAYAGKLFGAFQRLHAMSEFPGTGIGLATVQRIVNRHGGRIWAEAAVNQGATFYFALPPIHST